MHALAAGAVVALGAAQLAPVSNPVPRNWIVGTQEIYGAGYLYNFTQDAMLVEQTNAAVKWGGNQMKIVLSSQKTCAGYKLDCDASVVDLTTLCAVSGLADLFSDPRISWYHLWLESFATQEWVQHDWTNQSLAAEFDETKAWALHMLTTYNGTGKVFMAGNWEGDWPLMGASGCKDSNPPYKYNFSCSASPSVIERMVLWGKARQSAIDAARAEAVARGVTNVTLLYYIEFNLGPQALPPNAPGCAHAIQRAGNNKQNLCTSKPGVANSVLREVNPDLVSYSSYTTTNAYALDADVDAVDDLFFATMAHAEQQLREKPSLGPHPLGFAKRVFIGEFGQTPTNLPNATFAKQYLARVYSAAMHWGPVPFALYWELYSNNSTKPLIAPPPNRVGSTAEYASTTAYFAAARAKVAAEGGEMSDAALAKWAAQYWKSRTSRARAEG